MSHEEECIEYMSSLERQLPERSTCLQASRTTRSAAKRRCKEYDGDIDNHYTYDEADNTADHHEAEAAHEESAVQDMTIESAQCRFQINNVSY